ncbi:hypothetical protein KKB40_02915 [Patescibacteria group bacterium]|nr:hypothetical protein [Patescibacteria group bacterium]
MRISLKALQISFPKKRLERVGCFFEQYSAWFVAGLLTVVAAYSFLIYYENGLGLAYNDARSHLDIGRRVVEGLKPGLAQLGSVWLPLPHILMVPTIWNDFMWHSGLAGALVSMISFVGTGVIIYEFTKKLGVGLLGRFFAVTIFVANLNILYLQSTAMTELLLLAMMTAGVYFLMLWAKDENILNLIKSAFFIMLSSLVKYDGWFLFLFAGLLIALSIFRKRGYKTTEGMLILFGTLGGFGIALWFLWNLMIFGDPLYFIFGPYSARAQQIQMETAGSLPTKGNILLSLKIYLLSFIYNSYAFTAILGMFGALIFWINKKIKPEVRIVSVALIAPFLFNVASLFAGHSVIFIQGISGNTWFNIRYGILLLPSVAIFAGFLVDKLKDLRWVLIGLFAFTTFFAFANSDAVTIDDARVGSSQKNVTEVSGWLKENAADKDGFVLISAASHDAIIFSTGMPMKKFIHEGTGAYWESATTAPDRWARWIVMRTYDENDSTYKFVSQTTGFSKYELVDSYPFADIYQLRDEYLNELNTEPIFGKQK